MVHKSIHITKTAQGSHFIEVGLPELHMHRTYLCNFAGKYRWSETTKSLAREGLQVFPPHILNLKYIVV
jgi:hypothetical protein